jgi:hypothetical protein
MLDFIFYIITGVWLGPMCSADDIATGRYDCERNLDY